MARYARKQDGEVVEIITLPDDVALEDAFHPEIVSACELLPETPADPAPQSEADQ